MYIETLSSGKQSNQSQLFDNGHNQKRMWIYGVLTNHPTKKDYMIVKGPGQHICETKEQAIQYAQNNTIGKLRGVLQKEQVVFCVDMTELAKEVGMFYEGSKFDDYIRDHFPNWNGIITNDSGGSSRELLEFDTSAIDEEDIKSQLIDAVNRVTNQDLSKPTKEFTSRPYITPLLRSDYDSDKLLLAGCPGSGKETSTLTLFINHHDRLWESNKLNEASLHVAIATIPSTSMELIKELSDVAGMWCGGDYYDYSRIKPYVLTSFYKSYYPILNKKQKVWFKRNVTVVDSVGDIPKIHQKNDVPVLIGSFQDMGMKDNGASRKTKVKYEGLEERLGILSIGEAHKFLSNPNNKMWSNIDSINRKFLMLITGTPYDYIFNEESNLYFKPEERGIFTWIDLMREKILEPDGPFGNYPDVNYYGLPNLKDIIYELKDHIEWDDDIHSLTYKKLFTTMTEDGDFKYKDAILHLFKRLFLTDIDPFTNQSNGLNINSAPQLCDTAKRHMIIALPSGQDGVGVGEYVPLLTKLLNDSGILSEYKLLEVYEDGDVSDIIESIDNDSQKTITFTCTKYLTGTNIPAWGSVIFLRPIGNSIKLFEQIIGRVKRPFENKPNCGVFVGNIDEVMSIEVSITEKLSMIAGKSTPFKDIATEVLKCYNIFTGNNGSWEKIDFPDLVSRLEELSVKGNYGVSSCIRELKTPKNFDEIFETISGGKEDVSIVDNGGTKAKDIKKTTRSKQLDLFADEFKKAKDKDVYYRNMVKKHLAKMRLLCYTEELDTIQDAVQLIKTALENPTPQNEIILEQIGKGVEWIPHYMLDTNQIDLSYVNRWIHKINSDTISLESLLELLAEPELQEEDTAYYPTPLWLFDRMIDSLLDIEVIQNPIVLDPSAGRGTSLISFINLYQKRGIKIDFSNIYYNDIDPIKVKIFKKLNKEYNLGILEENIFCEDLLNPSPKLERLLKMKKPDVIIGNPPYNSGIGTATGNTIWQKFAEKSINLLKEGGFLAFVHPTSWRKPIDSITDSNGRFDLINQLMFSRQIHYLEMHDVDDGKKTFGVGTRYDVYILENVPSYKKTYVVDEKRNSHNLDFRYYKFLPNYDFDFFNKIISFDMKLNLQCIQSYSYEPRNKWVSSEKSNIYKYPLVHSTNKNKIRYKYSSKNDKGHFGIPKIIFGDSGINDVVIDMEGKFGMTHHAIGIHVNSLEEATNIKNALLSKKFQKFMKSLLWSNFGIDWKVFMYFRKDFWKEFIDD